MHMNYYKRLNKKSNMYENKYLVARVLKSLVNIALVVVSSASNQTDELEACIQSRRPEENK